MESLEQGYGALVHERCTGLGIVVGETARGILVEGERTMISVGTEIYLSESLSRFTLQLLRHLTTCTPQCFHRSVATCYSASATIFVLPLPTPNAAAAMFPFVSHLSIITCLLTSPNSRRSDKRRIHVGGSFHEQAAEGACEL